MLEDYTRFLTVAEHRSISHAAVLLNISQPALSRTIRLLEDRFGAALFDRTPQGVELTEAGKTLFLYANRAVRAVQSAREEIDHAQLSKRLTLRIACGDSWGLGILPPILRAFMDASPDVRCHLDQIENDARLRGLDTRNYDVAFGVISPEGLASGRYLFEPLVHAAYAVYCDKNHPLMGKTDLTAQDLLAWPWLNHKFEFDYDPSSELRTTRNFMHRSNSVLHSVLALRGSRMLLSSGMTMAPIFERLGIARLGVDPESPKFQSGIILSESAEPNQITRRFLSYVRAHCANL